MVKIGLRATGRQRVLATLMLCLLTSLPHAEISVVDDRGNTVTLPRPAGRIVALAPHIVELVYAVGSGARLVGSVGFSDYPPAAADLPQVGTHASFSLEAILRLQPDLVLAWYSGNGPQRVEPIRALGIPVFYTEPRSLDSIASVLERIGQLTAAPDTTVVADFRRRLQELRDTYSGRAPISVFYQVWNEPLRTLNGEHIISDVISLCGGYNVFADAIAIAPLISVESVLRTDPQVIIASGEAGERPSWLDDWQRWPQLQAVANGQVKSIPADIIQRHTPRILQGATRMCEQLQQARGRYGLATP